jgi:hypothetical protein
VILLAGFRRAAGEAPHESVNADRHGSDHDHLLLSFRIMEAYLAGKGPFVQDLVASRARHL